MYGEWVWKDTEINKTLGHPDILHGEMEEKDFEEATEYLLRAYALDGKAIFKNEDKKYFDFLKKTAKL